MIAIQKIIENFFIQAGSFLLWLVIVLIGKSLHIQYLEETPLGNLRKSGRQLIYALWHGQTFVPFYYKRKEKIILLTTDARRGRVLNGAVKKLGYKIISLTGFTPNKSWLKEFFKLVNFVKKGYDSGIVLDGPGGPSREIKPGVFLLSSKTQNPIIPIGLAMKNSMCFFWRWDKYLVPLPFSQVVIVCGPPLFYQGDISSEKIEELKTTLKNQLNKLNQKAQNLVK